MTCWYIPGSIETRWDVVNARRWQKIDRTPSRSGPTYSLAILLHFLSRSNKHTVVILAWYFSDVAYLISVFVRTRYYASKKYRVAIICIGESETITTPDGILLRSHVIVVMSRQFDVKSINQSKCMFSLHIHIVYVFFSIILYNRILLLEGLMSNNRQNLCDHKRR